MSIANIKNLEKFIKNIPGNVFFKDAECRYIFASEICDRLNKQGDDWTIVGKTDLEVQRFPELGRQYYEEDKKLIRDGGDEFLIICNGVDEEKVQALIDKLSHKSHYLVVKGHALSIAYGAVTMRENDYDYFEGHRVADERMYEMKREMKAKR